MRKIVRRVVVGVLVVASTIGLLTLTTKFEDALFGLALIGIMTCIFLFGTFLSWALLDDDEDEITQDEESQLTKREE